jgi:hypothetical protein
MHVGQRHFFKVGVLRRRDASLECNVALLLPPLPRLDGINRSQNNAFGVGERAFLKNSGRFT